MLIFFLRIFGFGASLTLSSIHHRCSFLCLAKFSKDAFHFDLFVYCLVLSKFPFPSLSFISVVQFSINIIGVFFCTFADHFLCVCFPLQVLVEFLCLSVSSFVASIAFGIFEKCTWHFICHSMFEFSGWGKVLLLDSSFIFLHCDFSCLLVWIFF